MRCGWGSGRNPYNDNQSADCTPGWTSFLTYAYDYDKKARELKQRQAEIELRIGQYHDGDRAFRTTLLNFIRLSSC
jgi:hypothetical protein